MVLNAKIVIIGDAQVGKTSLRNQYMGKGFPGDYLPTLGADFASIDVKIPDKKKNNKDVSLRFQIWDLAGQPSFGQIRQLYYQHAIGAILVFDINNQASLLNLERWMEEFSKHVGFPSVFLTILANKSDLRNEYSITVKETKKFLIYRFLPRFKDSIRDIRYYRTSAKTGENVDAAFLSLSEMILDSMR